MRIMFQWLIRKIAGRKYLPYLSSLWPLVGHVGGKTRHAREWSWKQEPQGSPGQVRGHATRGHIKMQGSRGSCCCSGGLLLRGCQTLLAVIIHTSKCWSPHSRAPPRQLPMEMPEQRWDKGEARAEPRCNMYGGAHSQGWASAEWGFPWLPSVLVEPE